jgi:hypothetical protein
MMKFHRIQTSYSRKSQKMAISIVLRNFNSSTFRHQHRDYMPNNIFENARENVYAYF